jgi:hypothetical protein
MFGIMKKKKETYRQRWLKEHPEIHIHLPKDVYNKLLELENILGKNKNDIVKDLINGVVINFNELKNEIMREIGLKSYIRGYNSALQKFVDFPDRFYEEIRNKYKIEPMLFSFPCSICEKPIIFSHEDEDKDDIKILIKEALFHRNSHACCEEVKRGMRESCEHIK